MGKFIICPLFCSSAIWFMSDILYYISNFFPKQTFQFITTKACQTYIKCRCQLHVKNVVWYNYLDETVEGLARCFFLNLSTDFGKWKANTTDQYMLFPLFSSFSKYLDFSLFEVQSKSDLDRYNFIFLFFTPMWFLYVFKKITIFVFLKERQILHKTIETQKHKNLDLRFIWKKAKKGCCFQTTKSKFWIFYETLTFHIMSTTFSTLHNHKFFLKPPYSKKEPLFKTKLRFLKDFQK